MVKIKTEPINVSNTTLSSFKGRRHRKFDAKQAKRHDFGKAHCIVCDVVFTKYHPRTKSCSEECKREKYNAYHRKYQRKAYAKNREKILAWRRKYREENLEKVRATERKYREENREKIAAGKRKYCEENREK